MKSLILTIILVAPFYEGFSQAEQVTITKVKNENKVNVFVGKKLFTSFLYADSLEKPVLYPLYSSDGMTITRGFPLRPRPGEPTDHPHHLGLWFTFENVNGLDFWNNSYAIPANKKQLYGWIRTDRIIRLENGAKGFLSYHANWTDQQKMVLLEETTSFTFSGTLHRRVIDRVTTLKADTDVVFADAKDGMLGLRVAHELQIPSTSDQKFTDDKGNVTIVKKTEDNVANGNYLTSEGKEGDSVWSTRAVWCKMYGRIGDDSISIAIIDHPENPNYPTFWHARGYGLFAANPLGEKIFTNGRSEKNLHLSKGESARFRYRIVVTDGKTTISAVELNDLARQFALAETSSQ